MEKNTLDNKITEVAKTLFAYCAARTPNRFEAEDLAQDIIVELYKSADTLRDEKAFYGFMWAVAGNVYRSWCKKKAQKKECALQETMPSPTEFFVEEEEDVYRLRRELALLNEKYRKAVVLYYLENKSCAQISKVLSISESMVKYLLFKARQILKEGMSMERTYGSQSYSPKALSLCFCGEAANRYYALGESKISQNILFACYHDKLTAEQVSLEIGVALPYMEDKLFQLYEHDLLKKEGNRYSTNLIIFTEELARETSATTAECWIKVADVLAKAIEREESAVRSLSAMGNVSPRNIVAWQTVSMILCQAIVERLQERVQIVYPKDKFGTRCFIWGVEEGESFTPIRPFAAGFSNVQKESGEYIQFFDFPINGEMVHHYFYNNQHQSNIFLKIAAGQCDDFSENDKAIAAELIKKGYVCTRKGKLFVNAPIFREENFRKLKDCLEKDVEKICEIAKGTIGILAQIIKKHAPASLKKQAEQMAYCRTLEEGTSIPVSILYDRKILFPYDGIGMLPTTYVVLK